MARERTHTHARTHAHATPPHVGNTPALLWICAFRRCRGALARSAVYVLRTVCSARRTPPSSPPDSQGLRSLQVKPPQICGSASNTQSLSYRCVISSIWHSRSCHVLFLFLLSVFILHGAGGVWEADVCPVSRPGPCWFVTSDRNTLRIKLAAIVQVQCSKKPP